MIRHYCYRNAKLEMMKNSSYTSREATNMAGDAAEFICFRGRAIIHSQGANLPPQSIKSGFITSYRGSCSEYVILSFTVYLHF
jgi:hypothetical protein